MASAGKEGQAAAEARDRALHAREKAMLSREQVTRLEEIASDARRGAALTREEAVRLSEDLVRAREEAADVAAERRQLVIDLKEANEKLTLMALRSQSLTDETEIARHRLEVSEGELRMALEFRERLIGIVSHDLRNPLGAVAVNVGLISRDGHLDEKGRQLAGRIKRSVDRMHEMIAQLLDFTRAHAGTGIPLEPQPTNLEEVCHHVIEELEQRHSSPGRFLNQFQGDLNGLWDAGRLSQVISNLGGNAIEHGTPGTPIEVKVKVEGEEVLLDMHNQGQVIAPELVPFIFDPFRRAEEQGKSKSNRLGLGLYIAEQIVHGHGGSISVHSTASEGTTFSVRLPRHGAEAGRSAH